VVQPLCAGAVLAHVVRGPAGTELNAAGGQFADQVGQCLVVRVRYVYAAMRACFSPYHAGVSLSESGVGVTADRLEAIAGCLQPEDS
jgi:hypothetical protein